MIEGEKYYCNKCNKCMTDENGTSWVGYSIEVNLGSQSTSDRALIIADKFLKKQLGKYKPNKVYDFCFECWLDSLFQI